MECWSGGWYLRFRLHRRNLGRRASTREQHIAECGVHSPTNSRRPDYAGALGPRSPGRPPLTSPAGDVLLEPGLRRAMSWLLQEGTKRLLVQRPPYVGRAAI